MWTSAAATASAGSPAGNVLRVCRDNGITARETTFSLTEVYSADEAFVTGTFAGVVPVRDGRRAHDRLRQPRADGVAPPGLYADLVRRDVRRAGMTSAWPAGPARATSRRRRCGPGRTGPDTDVVDEPFYAHYLARLDGSRGDHPGREDVLAAQPTEADARWSTGSLAPLPDGVDVQYVKHMTHHLLADDDLAWTVGAFRNVLLIRTPGRGGGVVPPRRAPPASPRTSASSSSCACSTR